MRYALLLVSLVAGVAVSDSRATTYAVDRIEGTTAVLVRDEDGAVLEVPTDVLPQAEEGAIYRWGVTFTRDTLEEARVRQAIQTQHDHLITEN
jgi:hypothetical protein